MQHLARTAGEARRFALRQRGVDQQIRAGAILDVQHHVEQSLGRRPARFDVPTVPGPAGDRAAGFHASRRARRRDDADTTATPTIDWLTVFNDAVPSGVSSDGITRLQQLL